MATQDTEQLTGIDALREEPMMAHLMGALEQGQDIGHYGRLVFVMVARHFLTEDEILEYLCKDKDCDEIKAKALVQQVNSRDYNPPRRDRILAWMREQEFPICPDSNDPDACNVYKDLKFPKEIYDSISSYREQKVEAEEEGSQAR